MGIGFPKPGIVRLKGAALKKLRLECYTRDKGRCVWPSCGVKVSFSGKESGIPPMHMAHIKPKRMHGDVISNVRTLCPKHHGDEHNAGGKPVRVSKAQALAEIARENYGRET